MVSRRDFLKITGGGFILSAAALGGFIGTRTPLQSFEPLAKCRSIRRPKIKSSLLCDLVAQSPQQTTLGNRTYWRKQN